MKKIFALLTSLVFISSAAACGKKNSFGTEKVTYTAEKLDNIAYRKASVELPADMAMIYRFDSFNSGNDFLILGSGAKTPQFWRTDKNLTSFEPVEIPDFEVPITYDYAVAADGTLLNFTVHPEVDPDDIPEDWDEKTKFLQNADFTFHIARFSPDGKMLSDNEVTGFDVVPNSDTRLSGAAMDNEKVAVIIDDEYHLFNISGTYIGQITPDSGEVEAIGLNAAGEMICAVSEGDMLSLQTVNSDGTLTAGNASYEFGYSINGNLLPGTGEWSAFIRTASTAYGIKASDQSIEPVFAVNKAGLTADGMVGFAMTDEGDIIVPIVNWSEYTAEMKRFTPCDPSEFANIETITVGTFQGSFFDNFYIELFNDTHQDVQAELKVYLNDNTGSEEAYEKASEQVLQDALSGDLPDVLIGYDMNGIFADIDMLEKDVAVDLYDYIDSDPDISREDFVPSALRLIDSAADGHAYVMPSTISLVLPNTAKTKFVKDIDDWNIDTYMDLYENLPEGMGFHSYWEWYREEPATWYQLCSLDWPDFVDFKNASCNFDSPQFIRMIEYASKGTDPDTITYSDPVGSTENAAEQFHLQQNEYAEDKTLFMTMDIWHYADYLTKLNGAFGGEDVTTLGEWQSPGHTDIINSAGDTFMVTKHSEHPELAWEFVKTVISDEAARKYYTGRGKTLMGGFPVTKSGLAIAAEAAKQPYDYSQDGYPDDIKDYTGVVYDVDRDFVDSVTYKKCGEVTDEVIEKVNKLINDAQPTANPNKFSGNDIEMRNFIYDIYYEETGNYFHGECTAEQCAERLQDRISIYLSENFS
ncbi:MAG TPA: extracellular solute-binding protein [Ruminococcus sp.]|nr:extracellular solute-binding protein [Ruminococcus sp.]